MFNLKYFQGKKFFVTGHTGFKGSWLALWIHLLGGRVCGYALQAEKDELYDLLNPRELLDEEDISDIRDYECLLSSLKKFSPEVVFHLAAAPLVRESYKDPLNTYSTNIMGTVNLLNACRYVPSIKTIINVTTDKCYQNNETFWGYRETDPMGGDDPYSSSKACSELISHAYRKSFFKSRPLLSTVRAGNVIGGGDFSKDRLIPDCLRAYFNKEKLYIRYPKAIRPWQYVLDPLYGYLLLAQKLGEEGGEFFEGSWNLAPQAQEGDRPVGWIVEKLKEKLNGKFEYQIEKANDNNKKEHLHEANYLRLDSTLANLKLGWMGQYNLQQTLDKIVEWIRVQENRGSVREFCINEIMSYQKKIT